MRRVCLPVAALSLAVAPQPAHAHMMLQGAGAFYAGLLHPVLVPGEALALVATGLLLGFSSRAASRLGLVALAAGLVVGLAFGSLVAASAVTPILLGIAFVTAGLVTAGLRLPPVAAALIALLAGVTVGIDARPEADTLLRNLATGAASVLGGVLVVMTVAGLIMERDRDWIQIAVRVAGSWITASAILYFAWLATGATN